MGTILSENKWVFEEAPCLVDSPYKEAARKFIMEALKFGRVQSHMMLRCLVSISLFNEKVKMEESNNNPVELFIESFDRHK